MVNEALPLNISLSCGRLGNNLVFLKAANIRQVTLLAASFDNLLLNLRALVPVHLLKELANLRVGVQEMHMMLAKNVLKRLLTLFS